MRINCIFVIESLTGEKKTGKILYDDVISKFRLKDANFLVNYTDVKNKKELSQVLIEIGNLVKNGNKVPIVHLECHGSKNPVGIVLEPSKEFIGWNEIEATFREINIHLKNRLIIALGVCFGATLTLSCDPSKRSPFFELITPKEKITNSEILSGYFDFYQGLLFGEKFIKLIQQLKINMKFGFYGSAHLYKLYCKSLNESGLKENKVKL